MIGADDLLFWPDPVQTAVGNKELAVAFQALQDNIPIQYVVGCTGARQTHSGYVQPATAVHALAVSPVLAQPPGWTAAAVGTAACVKVTGVPVCV